MTPDTGTPCSCEIVRAFESTFRPCSSVIVCLPPVAVLNLPCVSGLLRLAPAKEHAVTARIVLQLQAGRPRRPPCGLLWLRRSRNQAALESEDIMNATLTVKITPNDKGNPPGKLADAELHFTDGPLAGLKLIGFAIWERRTGTGRNVTFPARQYSVNGERRSFALLRPIADTAAQERIRDLVLEAYAEFEKTAAA
jgi:hypothetical protein